MGLAVTAFAWLPALTEQSAVHVELGRLPYLRFERSLWPVPVSLDLAYGARSGSADSPRVGVGQVVFLGGALIAGGGALIGLRRTGGAGSGDSRLEPFPWRTVGAAGLVAAVCFALNGTWSRRVWETAPLLANIQFAWRLWGPFSLGVAVLGAGAFSALAGVDRRAWLPAGGLTALVALNALTVRPPAPGPGAPVPPSPGAAEVRKGEESSLVVIAGTTSTGEFLPRSVVLDAPPEVIGGGREAYEGRFPGGGWVAGRVWPYAGTVRVRQVWETPAGTRAEVEVLGNVPAEVGFRTLVFPGWRAYVDGGRAPLHTPAVDPLTGLGHGFAVVGVPPGIHTVELALGSTPWRTAGAVAAIAGAGLAVALLIGDVSTGAARARPVCAVGAVSLLAMLLLVASHVQSLRWPPWSLPWPGRPAAPSIVLDFSAPGAADGGQQIAQPAAPLIAPHVRGPQSIRGQSRSWVSGPVPAQVMADVLVPERAVFQAGLGVDPSSSLETGAGPVRFLVEVVDGLGGRAVLLDEALHPQARSADRGWRFVLIDLGPYANRRVRLVLRTEAADAATGGLAGWADPAVYVDRSARYPPPTALAPALAEPGYAMTRPGATTSPEFVPASRKR